MSKIEIHRAAPSDVVSIMRLMQKSHARFFAGELFNEADALQWITRMVCTGICLNATMAGRIIGTMGLSGRRIPWNRESIQVETEWLHVLENFVESEARDSLIVTARAFCRATGCDFILSIPHYLQNRDDSALSSVGNFYFLRAASEDSQSKAH